MRNRSNSINKVDLLNIIIHFLNVNCSIGRFSFAAIKTEMSKLEKIICDLGPIEMNYEIMVFYKPCGKSYSIGQFCECDIDKYQECIKKYKEVKNE